MLKISVGSGYKPEVDRVREITWPDFCLSMKRAQAVATKAEAGWLAPVVFRDDYRSKDNAETAYAIGLDFDSGTTAEELREAMGDRLNYLLVSTHSHYEDGATPRYRLFIPYTVPMADLARHRDVWNYWKTRLPSLDMACADVSRMWFRPAAPAERLERFEHYYRADGEDFDWQSVPATPVQERLPSLDGGEDAPTFQPGNRHADFMRLAAQLRRGGLDFELAQQIFKQTCENVGAEFAHHVKSLAHVYQKYEAGETYTTSSTAPNFAAAPLPADLPTRNYPAHECIVAGYLPVGCVSLMASQDGLGKSRVALLIAAHVAAGRVLFDDVLCGDGSGVYCLNAEDPETEVYRRLKSVLHTFTPDEQQRVLRNLSIASPRGQIELIQQGNGVTITAQVDSIIEAAGKSRLIIMDTLSRMHGLDENSNSVASRLIGAAERIARTLNAAVLLVHHTGKAAAKAGDEGAGASRGAHAFEGNSRSVMRLMRPAKHDEEELILPRGVLKLVQAKFSYGPKQHPVWLMTDERGALGRVHPARRDADPAPALE